MSDPFHVTEMKADVLRAFYQNFQANAPYQCSALDLLNCSVIVDESFTVVNLGSLVIQRLGHHDPRKHA